MDRSTLPVTDKLYPETQPCEQGMLDVGDGNRLHWAVYGNPSGKPAAVVHGGPGSGSSPGMARLFDPSRYRIILFDQRGCGLSAPHASDPATDLSHNTTAHLIADIERLRAHLGVDRWLLLGGSWGSTLIVAYAEQYPSRVSEIVLNGVGTTRRSEIDRNRITIHHRLHEQAGRTTRASAFAFSRALMGLAEFCTLHGFEKRRRPGREGRRISVAGVVWIGRPCR